MQTSISFALGLAPLGYPSKTFSIKVVDEAGKPMNAIPVKLDFILSIGTGNPQWKEMTAITDSSGMATGSGQADEAGYKIDLDGFYQSKGLKSLNDHGVTTAETVVKKRDNPKPMYAKNMSATIPADGKTYSYDLMMGDWLPPLGHGVTPDFVFKGTAQWNSLSDYNQGLQLSFSNLDDGIQAIAVNNDGSALRLSKKAPTAGYVSQWAWRDADASKQDISSMERTIGSRAFFFRVRSSRDAGGTIRAMYGKISHDVVFGFGSKRQDIYLRIDGYYLNPDGTTAMEFDVNKDLLLLKWPEL